MNDASTEETHIDMSCELTLLQFEKRQLQNKLVSLELGTAKVYPYNRSASEAECEVVELEESRLFSFR